MFRKSGFPSLALAVLLTLTAPAARAWVLNMPEGVSTMSGEVHSIHMTIFWWCVAIGVFVFGWMILSIVKFRKADGAVPDTSMVHNTRVEVIWTVIPVLILVIMAVPAARTLIRLEDTRGTELSIKVTGYQWKWQYEYLDHGVSYFSSLARESDATRQLQSGLDPNAVQNYLLDVDNPLVVPVGRKVRVLLTAQDVIHAWWVPAFAVKKDAIPGFVNEAWFEVQADKPGTYRGQCAELCGRDHGFMPVVVEAKTQADFDAWLKSKQEAQRQASVAGRPNAG